MAKTKAEKAVVIEKLESGIKNTASSVFVHFTRVTVAEESAMRRGLRENGVAYIVAKKTLIRRALGNLGHKHEELPLEGEIAIAYGGGVDATAPARLLHEFGKKLRDASTALGASKLMILGGIFEGALLDQGKMQEIAIIPPMQTLRGMFVNVINSPIQGLAIALNAIAQKKR
jgi:large subunit ribosomal protein L10